MDLLSGLRLEFLPRLTPFGSPNHAHWWVCTPFSRYQTQEGLTSQGFTLKNEWNIHFVGSRSNSQAQNRTSPCFSRQWPKQCVLTYWILLLVLSLSVRITLLHLWLVDRQQQCHSSHNNTEPPTNNDQPTYPTRTTTTSMTMRLFFLDWFLIVGTDALTALDQAYFMPLFFFISAYFSKLSYAKRGLPHFWLPRNGNCGFQWSLPPSYWCQHVLTWEIFHCG
jgi:hypothetical protein